MAVGLVVSARVGALDQGLQLGDVVGVGEVDDVDGHIVLLESHAHVLILLLSLLERVADEEDDPLLLRLILSVLEGELGYLYGGDDVRVAIDLAGVDAVDQVPHVVGLG